MVHGECAGRGSPAALRLPTESQEESGALSSSSVQVSLTVDGGAIHAVTPRAGGLRQDAASPSLLDLGGLLFRERTGRLGDCFQAFAWNRLPAHV